MHARRLIVALPKGGSGKTATAVAFAWALEHMKKRVLLADLDPQGHSGAALGVSQTAATYRVGDWLLNLEAPFAPTEVSPFLHVVPATPHEAGLDRRVEQESYEVGPILVRTALDRVADQYDYIICDCPPNLAAVSYNALLAGPVLAPVEMNRLAVSTVPALLRAQAKARARKVYDARLLALLPTRCSSEHTIEYRQSFEMLGRIAQLGNHRVTRARIPLATAIARSLAESRFLFGPEYRDSIGPPAYLAAVDEVLPLLEEDATHG